MSLEDNLARLYAIREEMYDIGSELYVTNTALNLVTETFSHAIPGQEVKLQSIYKKKTEILAEARKLMGSHKKAERLLEILCGISNCTYSLKKYYIAVEALYGAEAPEEAYSCIEDLPKWKELDTLRDEYFRIITITG